MAILELAQMQEAGDRHQDVSEVMNFFYIKSSISALEYHTWVILSTATEPFWEMKSAFGHEFGWFLCKSIRCKDLAACIETNSGMSSEPQEICQITINYTKASYLYYPIMEAQSSCFLIHEKLLLNLTVWWLLWTPYGLVRNLTFIVSI